MKPKKISNKINVKQCFLCQLATEYHCHSCHKDLCQHCKAMHVIDLDTKDHKVTIYREKFKYLPKRDKCVIHSNMIYTKYCEPCEVPVCGFCSQHKPQLSFNPVSSNRMHNLLDIKTVYQIKRQQHNEIIHNVRSETLYSSRVLLKKLKSDVNINVKTCQRKLCKGQSQMMKTGQGLKHLTKRVLLDEMDKNRCLKQKIEMTQYLAMIQNYEYRYEQSANRPIKFLLFFKKVCLPKTPHLTQHYLHLLSMTQKINTDDLMRFLSKILITEGVKLQTGNELLLTLLPSPLFQKSVVTVKGVNSCIHISCVTPERVWVSDGNKIILTDTTTAIKLHSVHDSSKSLTGIHTVNSESELIYIDKDYNINKLSPDLKTTTTFLKKPDSLWEPKCVHCSPSTGDLLVGICRGDIHGFSCEGQVRRYNNTGKLTQTIPHNNVPHTLFGYPRFITENNNGDVVVSDYGNSAVVVTEREGQHRFSYLGHSSKSRLNPHGVCTNAMSHILVCDYDTRTVQIISKDGQFLSYLLTRKSPGIHRYGAQSLSYDVNTHLLWVGSKNINTMSLYKHVNRHLDLTDGLEDCDTVNTSPGQDSTNV